MEQEIKNDSLEIIHFFREFDKYDSVTNVDLFNYLQAFIDNKHYKSFKHCGLMTGYVSWAFFDDLNQHIFKKTGIPNKINSGDNLWIVDIVSTHDVKMQCKWLLNYFTNKFGANKKINYLRIDQYNNISTVGSKYTKEYHRWAE